MLPRHVKLENNKLVYDNLKLVVENHKDDKLMLENVFHGKIISSKIYPLIYDEESDVPEIKFRSLSFYRKCIQDNNLYEQLEDNYKIYFMIGLRDLYIASQRNLLNDEENQLLLN